MKIGLILYGSLDTLSGGYLYDRQLVSHLRACGWHVDILSLPWRDYVVHLGDNLRITWVYQIAKANYDLLLQDELNHPSLFLLNILLHRICACPIISIVHHLRSSEEHPARLLPIYRFIEQTYLNSVNGFIFNSETTRKIVHRHIGHVKPHTVAMPAADHRNPPPHTSVVDALSKNIRSSDPLQMLFIGNIIARKGLHTVLHALAQLPGSKYHLHIVGSTETDPSYTASVRRLARDLSLTPHLTWHGRVSDEILANFLEQCDLLVMPSFEGFGIVYLEAMAYGLPVIAANTGAAPEIITHGQNGYLISPNDHCNLANYLRLLADNRVQVATLGYQARIRYEEHPSWEASMNTVSLWLREALHTYAPFHGE